MLAPTQRGLGGRIGTRIYARAARAKAGGPSPPHGASALQGVTALFVVGLFLVWPQKLGSRADRGPIDIGAGEQAPEDSEVKSNVTYLGNWLAIAGDATLYGSLLFGVLYLPVVAPGCGEAM